MLQDHVVAKGLEYDNKYNVSSRLTGFLSTLQSNGKKKKREIYGNVEEGEFIWEYTNLYI